MRRPEYVINPIQGYLFKRNGKVYYTADYATLSAAATHLSLVVRYMEAQDARALDEVMVHNRETNKCLEFGSVSELKELIKQDLASDALAIFLMGDPPKKCH